MRRLVALLIVALLGATAYGVASGSSAVAVSGQDLSFNSFTNELKVIAASPTLACYLKALDGGTVSTGAGSSTFTSASAAQWASLRVQGLAISQYVKTYLKYTPSAKDLATATQSLLAELTSAASSANPACVGSSAEALAEMPTEMRDAEVADQAYSTYYVSRLNGTIPLTLASIDTYYQNHRAQYDTLCVSIALVSPTNLTAFSAAQAKGESVALLAKQYSSDPSSAKGGAYGCYSPSNSSYASVRADTATTPLNTFPKGYQVINYNGGAYALFVAPTKRTPTPLAEAQSAVYADIQSANATVAKTQEARILYAAAVSIDPAFARWGLGTSGPSVFAKALPAATDVNAPGVLSLASTTTYK